MDPARKGSSIGGIILLLIGSLFLIGNLSGQPFWMMARFIGPGVVILLGFYFLYRLYGPDRTPGKVAFPWPLFMILGGCSALAAMLGYWQFSTIIGPAALIIVGGWMLFRR